MAPRTIELGKARGVKDTIGTAVREGDYNAPDRTYREGVTLLELGLPYTHK